ncbi:MAG: hypothetical protein V3S47_07620, partial [Acidobacteriota bacterium]
MTPRVPRVERVPLGPSAGRTASRSVTVLPLDPGRRLPSRRTRPLLEPFRSVKSAAPRRVARGLPLLSRLRLLSRSAAIGPPR